MKTKMKNYLNIVNLLHGSFDISKVWHQKNLPTKRKQTHRHTQQTCGCHGAVRKERDETRVWGWQVQTVTVSMDKQQGPDAQHKGPH